MAKKLIALALCMAMALSFCATPATAVSAKSATNAEIVDMLTDHAYFKAHKFFTTCGLNIRKQPKYGNNVLTVLPASTAVMEIDDDTATKGWTRISTLNGKVVGYVGSKYLVQDHGSAGQMSAVIWETVNLSQYADKKAPMILSLPCGTNVTYLGDCTKGWADVKVTAKKKDYYGKIPVKALRDPLPKGSAKYRTASKAPIYTAQNCKKALVSVPKTTMVWVTGKPKGGKVYTVVWFDTKKGKAYAGYMKPNAFGKG